MSHVICHCQRKKEEAARRKDGKKKVSLKHFARRYQRLMEVGGRGWRNLWKSLKFLLHSFNDFFRSGGCRVGNCFLPDDIQVSSAATRTHSFADARFLRNSMSRHCSFANDLLDMRLGASLRRLKLAQREI